MESQQAAHKKLYTIHPFLYGLEDSAFKPYSLDKLKKCDIVFITKPHTIAMKYVYDLWLHGIKIIDLSADFRLQEPAVYRKWYGIAHKYPNLLNEAVYGLPELYADRIKKSSLIANPGCYPTCIILGLAPLLNCRLIYPQAIHICAYSGLSGAGRTPRPGNNLFIDAYGNLKPYKMNKHPHIPEIEQELSGLYQDKVEISFIPHLAPTDKGILSTIHVSLQKSADLLALIEVYKKFYKQKPFIRIYDTDKQPELLNVVGTNFCDIGLSLDRDGKTLVVFSVIDNTLKGSAGQAVQNMNLLSGYKET